MLEPGRVGYGRTYPSAGLPPACLKEAVLHGGSGWECGQRRTGMSAIAITDHGNVYGAYDFYTKAGKAGIKPIIGIEAYVAPEHRGHKQPVRWGTPAQRDDDVSGAGAYTHMTLFAETTEGMHNLFRLASLSSLEGYFRKPRMDRELLSQYAK